MESASDTLSGMVFAYAYSTLTGRYPLRTNLALNRQLAYAPSIGQLLVPSTSTERRSLNTRVSSGEVVMPYPGAYAETASFERLNARMKARAVIKAIHRIHPNWVFCLYSAALIHGLQVSESLLDVTHIAIAPNTNWRKTSGCIQSHTLHDSSITSSDNVPCIDLLATLLDCLCASSFRHGLAIVDSALHYQLTTKEGLEQYFLKHGRRRHGIGQARRTLAYADGACENGGESIVRAIIIELGFAVPEMQVEIEDPLQPGHFKRVDFFWELPGGSTIIGELDGLEKYLGRGNPYAQFNEGNVVSAVQAMRRERIRESRLNLTGARVLRFSYADALDTVEFFKLLSTAGVPLQ